MKQIVLVLNNLFDLLWRSSSIATDYIYIIVLSLLSAVLFLWIFKKVSNQNKIKHHKRVIVGQILQIHLYRDQIQIIISSILRIIWHNLLYLRYNASPLLVIVVPLFIISMQINNRCGYKRPGENDQLIIKAVFDINSSKSSLADLKGISLVVSKGLKIEIPPLRIPDKNEAYWRVRVISPVDKDQEYIAFKIGDNNEFGQRTIATNFKQQRFAPVLSKWWFSTGLLNNAEDFLPDDSPITFVSVDYKRAAYRFLFWETDPLIIYFILTLISALIIKPVFKVVI